MIVYHKNNEINRKKWDNCISNSNGVKPYAYSWYLDLLAPGWQALVDDDYDAVFPLPGFSKYGIRYIATPVFLQQLGAFAPDKPVSNVIIEFLRYIPEYYRLIDLAVGRQVELPGFKVTQKSNFELDLSETYGTLRERFTPHCIRNIDSASREIPELMSDVTPDEIIDLFIINKGSEIKGIKPRDYKRLKNLINFCLKNNKGRIIGVRGAQKRLIFGIFTVETPGNLTMLFVVNTPQSRDRRIGYYVVNKLIEDHSSTSTILDFAGSSIPSVASFMRSFGSVDKPYCRIYRNTLCWPLRILK